jgi:xanthine dehydrogenase molybdenum-binding subunit
VSIDPTFVVGTNVARPDAYDKVTGGRGYPVNAWMPQMLHGKLLRSPHAHARIRHIDTSRAEKLPGVRAVLTAAHVPNIKFHPVFASPSVAHSMILDMLILSDTVRFVGEPVAAVAASSVEIAEEALHLIDIEYEPLPAVFTPEEACAPGAPTIHEHAPGNIAMHPAFSFGDIEHGFAEADRIFEGTYSTQRVHTCYMEPRVCVVDYDRAGNVTAVSSCQSIFGLREKLAFALDIPISKVTVLRPPYIGGAFGGKLDMGFIEPIAALLSRKAGRPVRIEQTRAEDFITTTRNPITMSLKTGVRKDGRFTARYASSVLDTGAHATHGTSVLMVHGFYGFLLPYKCPNQKWEGSVVYTNNMIGGGFRGYGGPQAAFAVESQIDEICTAMGLDPIDFRLRNARAESEPHPFDPSFTLSSYRLEECLRIGAKKFAAHARGADSGPRKRGIGMAAQPMWVSGCNGFPDYYEQSGAAVKLGADGTASVSIGTIDVGGGQTTVLTQIVAEEIGIPAGSVQLTSADTNTVPFEPPTHASRTTYSAGIAARAAATTVRRTLLESASQLVGGPASRLTIRDGRIFDPEVPERSVSVADIVRLSEAPATQVVPDGIQKNPLNNRGSIMAVSTVVPPSNPSPASAEFVEVEVDTDTGEVRVIRVLFVHDIGRVIHPMAAEGQVEGGFQQGMGYALMENLLFDNSSGECLAGDFFDYKMPTAVEMPAQIESIFIESNEPTGPFGAKSLASSCVIVPAPAIANAISNAIGVRIRDLPITPEKILAALGKL